MSPVDRAAHLNRWRSRSLAEKSVLAFGMMAFALVFPPFPVAPVVAVVMTAATLLGARVSPRTWLACVAAPVGFLLVGSLSLALQVGDGGIGLAPDGLATAAGTTARALACVTALLFLALTTPATDLVAGARRLGLPGEIAEIALLTYRFLFLFGATALAMDAAQAARLGHAGAGRRLRSLGLLIANLLPRSLYRARRLEVGLAARGWTGEMRVLSRRTPVSRPVLALIVAIEAGVAGLGLWAR
ncbi:cobalt ECF transporter T component CbiQ [Rhodoplanes azumiensis]|uniref:Cobalt ECF transporter T component CbiQ n=1 Tax=Rhodoplanes azumiensis TaxID=1897628 RepID=A0ABW5AEX9_9BRAD